MSYRTTPEDRDRIWDDRADGYIAILTTGAVVRIPGNAVISDQPFSVKTPVKLSVNENAAISATDPTKTTHGVIPTGTSRRTK